MNVSTVELQVSEVTNVASTEDVLTVVLADGRSISVPLSWYPRLVHATQKERDHWRLIGESEGIHWPDLDEDISIQDLLGGWPSGESRRSFQRWLEAKREGRPLTLDALREHERREQGG
ncbi:MAG: DUF2442 domain-containing protein [Chloroflexi bacterium]|nr:DUF2442 domain-containing protein [Chloroflexota bacterium]